MIPITRHIHTLLEREIRRTGIRPRQLLSDAPDCPDGLEASHVVDWINGARTHAPEPHLAYVLRLWFALPRQENSRPRKPYGKRDKSLPTVTVTPRMRIFLRDEALRTGMTHARVIATLEPTPIGLTPSMVSAWLRGATKSALQQHWDWLIAGYAATPDKTEPAHRPPGGKRRPEHRPIKTTDIKAIRAHRTRTGITFDQLLRDDPDRPPGLSANMMTRWVSAAGGSADPAFVAYVKGRYSALPDRL